MVMKVFRWIGLPIVDDEGGNFFCSFHDALAAVLLNIQMFRAHGMEGELKAYLPWLLDALGKERQWRRESRKR